jgi:ferric-dicitrate binding protein FerR (iron transport regulator)
MPRRKKDELTQHLEAAREAGRYMVAVWSVKDGQVGLFRLTSEFPIQDIQTALDLLKNDLDPITIKPAPSQNFSSPPS